MEFKHTSVLLDETIENLNIRPDGVYMDGTLGGAGHSKEIAKRLGPDVHLIGIDQDGEAIITAKELGVPYILAKSNNDEAAKILSKIGADKVIYPEKDAGINVARKLLCSNFLEFFEISDNVNVAEISVRPEWVGKTLKELDFRRSYNMNIILVKEDGRSIEHITPELQLKESYRLLVTISNEGLKRMMQ